MSIEGIEVIQAAPGQLSLAVAKLKGNEALTEDFKSRLAEIPGIKSVDADYLKGEVKIAYDMDELNSLRSLWALKDAMAVFFPDVGAMELASYFGKYL
jgi:hypothetical protein